MTGDIIIIDYGMGNLRSVQKKVIRCGANAEISSDPEKILKAEKLILPGVGHFANGVKRLKERNIWDALQTAVITNKTPILGICLGMQLMAGPSEEGDAEGLGWFDAEIVKFKIQDTLKYKVPHMGWNNAIIKKKSPLMNGLSDDAMFYFVHSYHIKCNNPQDVLTVTNYEYEFVSAIQKDNIYGTQFHPEKSHDDGELLIKNFLEL